MKYPLKTFSEIPLSTNEGWPPIFFERSDPKRRRTFAGQTVTTKQPLSAGEYGFMALPKAQSTFSEVIYDFAIDTNVPENGGALTADP